MIAVPAAGVVPTAAVLPPWRQALGAAPLEQLMGLVLKASAAEHETCDYRVLDVEGLRLGAIDGTITRTPDTPGNRAAFGSTGTGDDTAPYPQVRDLWISDAGTRGTLGVLTGPSGGDKAEAEQKLLDRALIECAWLFTKNRLWIMDRNFPGVPRIARMIQVCHVLIRVKSNVTITRTGDFLPDGSYMADVDSRRAGTIRMRVIEYDVTVEGQDVPECGRGREIKRSAHVLQGRFAKPL